MNSYVYLNDEKQIAAIESIRRLDEEGYLYEMDAAYNYYELPKEIAAIIDAGCSCFVTRNLEGDILFCRNYDYSHYPFNQKKNGRTGLNMVVKGNNPQAKYKSIGVADDFWIDFRNGSLFKGAADDGKSDLSAFVLSPYLCMDGMNEQGLAIAILALCMEAEWKEIDYASYQEKLDENKENFFYENAGEIPDPYLLYASHGSIAVNKADQKAWIAEKKWIATKGEGKKNYLHPVMMRLVLDNCANIDEAIAFMETCNVKGAMPGADYHIFVADSLGGSVLVEWDGDEMKVTDIDHATNHYVCKEDPFFKDGCGRDRMIEAGLFRTRKSGMRDDFVENLLKLVIQDPTNGTDKGKTQYTCIYNLSKKTLKVYSYGDMSRHFDYNL